MIDVKRVGAFISECRKENEWTQKQLGEMLGVTDRAVSKWETGRSLEQVTAAEKLWAAVLAAAGLIFTVGVRIFGCRTRKLK